MRLTSLPAPATVLRTSGLRARRPVVKATRGLKDPAMQHPIDLYTWTTPNGWKAVIALEEMGLPYTVHWVDISKGEQFAQDFLKIAPNNRIPAIVDPQGPDGEPISVFESGAILQYLARKTGRFAGDSARERVAVEEWLMWQMGGLGPMAGQAHHFMLYAPETISYAVDRYRDEVARLYGVLNRRLEGRDYVAGPYSIADMAIWPWAARCERQRQDMSRFPNVTAWMARLWRRDAVRKARMLGETRSFEDIEASVLVGAQAV
jgi:GST-like protein